jgi:probable rRNA maturation factor
MVTLQIKRSVRLPVDKNVLLTAAQITLDTCKPGQQVDVSLVLGNDALLKKLNRQFLKVDAATDVLSFPAGEMDPDTAREYLGDVVVSLPRAQDQAAAGGHSLSDELQLLVVHGVLHLLGYDHIQPADKIQMQAAQDKILKSLGIHMSLTL